MADGPHASTELSQRIRDVAFVGWRGMVGSVLLERMQQEGDFEGLRSRFFSTSQAGQLGPDVGSGAAPLLDAADIDALSQSGVILTCQGGDYTHDVLPRLRAAGWDGYWIDAASAKRMDDDSVIILDPINGDAIDAALDAGTKNFIGGNCTVSLMLMALGGLFREGLVEWLSSMTYQAATGAGAKTLRELVEQVHVVGGEVDGLLSDPATAALDLDRRVIEVLRSDRVPTSDATAPLLGNLLPWIDRAMEDGETREEWKGFSETNKILGCDPPIPVDGVCVRVGAMRCHSQAFTIKLTRDLSVAEVREIVAASNGWVKVVDNDKASTLRELTPVAVTGTLDIPVGRIRKMKMGPTYLSAFTVGDQLLWGAAEPLRRMLSILRRRYR